MNNKTPVVLTASEFKELVKYDNISASKVDVVTCATFGIMSGVMAFFSFFASDSQTFKKAVSISFNGVPGFPGPCPNENNGWVDAVFYGTSVSESNPKYGGGHLFKDIVSGKPIEVDLDVIDSSGNTFSMNFYKSIDDFKTARMVTTRSCFKNYTAFVNPNDSDVDSTIFSVLPFKGNLKEATVSGCGELNPLENDPSLKHHKQGTKVLLNGSVGFILGKGTRSEQSPNLSISADMKNMVPDLMGGFLTSSGPECMTSVATAIPVSDSETFECLKITNDKITLPIASVSDRIPFDFSTYADVWKNKNEYISFSKDDCLSCKICSAQENCPVGAIVFKNRKFIEIKKECVVCLTCLSSCKNNSFNLFSDGSEAESGSLELKTGEIPFVLRQSDKNRAEYASLLLKMMIENNLF